MFDDDDPEHATRVRARFLGIRREILVALMNRRHQLAVGERMLVAEAWSLVSRPSADDLAGADFLLLSRYKQIRVLELMTVHLHRRLWEFERRADGTLPAEETPEQRRLYHQPYLEALARALHACLPVAHRIPIDFRATFVNALRLARHWGADGLREETWFDVTGKKRWIVGSVITLCIDKRIEDFLPAAGSMPDQSGQSPLPAGIFDLNGFAAYCARLAATAGIVTPAYRRVTRVPGAAFIHGLQIMFKGGPACPSTSPS